MNGDSKIQMRHLEYALNARILIGIDQKRRRKMSYKSVWDFGRGAKAKVGPHGLVEYPSKILAYPAHEVVLRFSKEDLMFSFRIIIISLDLDMAFAFFLISPDSCGADFSLNL